MESEAFVRERSPSDYPAPVLPVDPSSRLQAHLPQFKITMELFEEMSESEDDILIQKRRNQMFVEFDSSPLQIKIMAEAEENNENMEKLLMERVMLRKELRLRNVQERLVDTTTKLEDVERKVEKYEGLPGFRQFLALAQLAQFALETGGSGAGLLKRTCLASTAFLYRLVMALLTAPCSLFYLLPASLQMLSASLVATLASWLGETAENVSNECRERTDLGMGDTVKRNKSRRRKRS